MLASWASEPLVACNFTGTLPVGVESTVVIVNDCGALAVTLSGEDGFVVAPAGNPDMATDTLPANPLTGLIDTVAELLVPPAMALSDAGATEIAKSGAGGGGDDPPPQPSSESTNSVTRPARMCVFIVASHRDAQADYPAAYRDSPEGKALPRPSAVYEQQWAWYARAEPRLTRRLANGCYAAGILTR
jgi:hypothetical protein